MDGLCQCGCGGKTSIVKWTDNGKGWVKGEPKRYLCGHQRRRPPERIFDQIEKKGDCWLFIGNINRGGYGRLSINGRHTFAHRASWELSNGPIPDGLTIDHLCRTRSCINPKHMELVTIGENVLRGIGITARNVKKTHCPKGHEYNEKNTKGRDGKRHCGVCERERYHRRKECLAQIAKS